MRYYCKKYKKEVKTGKAFGYCLKSHQKHCVFSLFGCPYLVVNLKRR
jgi:hypothetical protein